MRMRSTVTFSLVALILGFSMYLNYQLIARFNYMCGQVMGVVDGVYETTASDEAKFRLGTMADVCFVRGWDWSQMGGP